jgi:hypothetical protein
MKRAALIFIGAMLLSCLSASSSVSAQQPQESTVTLYSVNKHRGEQLKFCVNFKTAPTGLLRAPCDVRYGALYAGDELDWFESSAAQGNRSVIKDLGNQTWTSEFEVPVVEPLPELKPGEQRHITIDTSGADGADGAPGAPGKPGNADSAERASSGRLPPVGAEPGRGEFGTPPSLSIETPVKSRPKQDGKPRIDPMFVRAIPEHIYVIHVVDDARDFYALFRVEALQRGDQCTISWKLIPAPSEIP